eukprot:2248066-Prymnesium_polylepis.1
MADGTAQQSSSPAVLAPPSAPSLSSSSKRDSACSLMNQDEGYEFGYGSVRKLSTSAASRWRSDSTPT